MLGAWKPEILECYVYWRQEEYFPFDAFLKNWK
jgi:hypothetical protein